MNVFLVHNQESEKAVNAYNALCSTLDSLDISYVSLTNETTPKHCASTPDDLKNDIAANCDFAFSIGGDGTILRCARSMGFANIPIYGINYGHLGFLANAIPETIKQVFDDFEHGLLLQEKRSVLAIEGLSEDGTPFFAHALNEFVFSRGSSGRMIDFDIYVNGSPFASMRGDGIMVATATGSTGYALSAGGPIVAPSFKGLEIVPIAPHSLFSRPILLDENDSVTINLEPNPFNDTSVFVDGLACKDVIAPKHVTVTKSEYEVTLVRSKDYDFYKNVSRVFFGGDR